MKCGGRKKKGKKKVGWGVLNPRTPEIPHVCVYFCLYVHKHFFVFLFRKGSHQSQGTVVPVLYMSCNCIEIDNEINIGNSSGGHTNNI